MKYKAIIFDMDGTIIDSDHIWNQATRSLITRRGIILSNALRHELEMRLVGCALSESCKVIKQIANIQDEVDELVREKTAHAARMFKQHITFIDGFLDFHAKLSAHKIPMALATNADDTTFEITCRSLNLEKFFGRHMYPISRVNNQAKPDPAIFLHAAQQLTIAANECVVIEDSAHGIRAAKRAGMFCIGINSTKRPDLLRSADIIINRYDEIHLDQLLEFE